MDSVTDAPLAALVREADPDTVTGFVAALYEAQGWTVDSREDRHLVVSDGGREQRVAVVTPADRDRDPAIGPTADTVVAVGDVEVDICDAEVIGATELRQRLAYAIDRPVARELLDSYFDWSPGEASEKPGTVGDRRGADSEEGGSGSLWPLGHHSRVLVAGLVVLAVAGSLGLVALEEFEREATVIGADEPGAGGEPTTPTPTRTTTSAVETETASSASEQAAAFAETTPAPEPTVETNANLPPGIDANGTISPRRLADRHESVLANESYRLTLTYREFVDDRPTGLYTETIRVVNATRYRASVSTTGTLRATPFRIAETDVFADGRVRYERDNSSVERASVLSYDRFRDDNALYLLWFLDVRESSIHDSRSRDGTTRLFVVTEGNSYPTIENTTGSVVVTEDGLVEYARWSYDIAGTPPGYGHVSVVFRMRVSDVGSTTVTRPDWADASASR